MLTHALAIAGLMVGCIIFGLVKMRIEKPGDSVTCGACGEDSACAKSCPGEEEKHRHNLFVIE